MPGNPVRRARKLAAAQAATGLDSDADIPSGVPSPSNDNTPRARVFGPPKLHRVHAPPRPSTLGGESRRVVDNVQASALREAAAVLQPGITLLIERLEPQWCGGFQAYYELETDNVLELYTYMKETWGGRRYKVTALSPDGKPAWDMRMNIGGQPLEESVPIDRAEYLGLPSALQRVQAIAAPAPVHVQQSAVDPIALLKLIMDAQREGARERTEGFEAIVQAQAEQTRGLVEAVTRRDQQQETRTSFRSQLGEVVEATQALEQVRDVLGPREPRGGRRSPDDDDPMKGALREAGKDFLTSFAKSRLSPMGAGARASAPTHVRETPQNTGNSGDIPAGVPSGQRRQK